MKNPLGLDVCSVRKFGGAETPQTPNNSVHLDRSKPALAVRRFAYTEQPPGVVLLSAALVLLVQAFRSWAEVGETVVVFAAVFVVQIFCGPQTGVHRPSHAVRQQMLPADGDVAISFGVDGTRNISRSNNAAAMNLPHKRSCFWGVGKNLAQEGYSWEHTEIMA